jgi:hypothetical protein
MCVLLPVEDVSTGNNGAANILITDQKKSRKNSTTLKNGGQSRHRQTAPRTKLEKKTREKALNSDNQTA